MASSTTPPLILASASPARLQLLHSIGIEPCSIIPADIDETPLNREIPLDYVKRISQSKASTIDKLHPGSIILAADSIVTIGRDIIGKATDEAHAKRIIRRLASRRHTVMTGICVIDARPKDHPPTFRSRVVKTTVKFCALSDQAIDAYIATGEWQGKAGAFGIQGRGSGFIERINGSYSNVVGLPLVETKRLLHGAGYLSTENG